MDDGLFKNKYRIASARYQGCDYSSNGCYYVTICTKDKQCYFGDIQKETMTLSPIGKIVKEEWIKTGKIRKNVRLNKWVIMPNHFHGIIVIDDGCDDEFCRDVPLGRLGLPL